MQVIIYKQGGKIVVMVPTADAVQHIGLHAIAKKDVPTGVPYKLLPVDKVPTTDEALATWDIPDAEFTDGVGEDWGHGSNNVVVAWFEGGVPVLRPAMPA